VEHSPSCGVMKAIVSQNCRIRHPVHFEIGENSIVDDFCYFSTRVKIGCGSHVASGCSVAGGKNWEFHLGDFSSLSSGVKIWCSSNDFVNDLVAIVPVDLRLVDATPVEGDVVFGNYTGVGSNSVVMPDNTVPEGAVIGALSFVPAHFPFEAWTVYAGNPLRRIKARNRDRVLKQADQVLAWMEKNNEC